VLDNITALTDPRDPNTLHQRWIMKYHPDRCHIITGEPGGSDKLIAGWKQSTEAPQLGEWVAKRAWLALEREERRLHGNRYKVPKFVADEITTSGSFTDGLSQLSDELRKSYSSLAAQSKRYIKEIAARHSTVAIDLIANLIHVLYRQGYGRIHYDADHLKELYQASETAPLVFLPSHTSQLDRLVLQFVLWENDLPPNHTAGGINLNFFPIGPMVRRTGVFFIRRSFKDNLVYKFSLRSYIDFLLAKRFPLEWYMEGGRSRTGKLRSPSFGLLSYVVSSFKRGATDDVVLLPVSISYDQIQDVGAYSAEARGEKKQSESLAWLWKTVRELRKSYGDVHIRFGEPIGLGEKFQGPEDRASIDVPKLAFEVMHRINEVRPITPTAAVCLVLLQARHPISLTEIQEALVPLGRMIKSRKLPTTGPFGAPDDIETTVKRLEGNGLVRIEHLNVTIVADEEVALSFYKNTMINHLLIPAIAQLASELDGDSLETAEELRDLLKFDFFFSDRASFRSAIETELPRIDAYGMWLPDVVLLAFLEAHYVIADALTDGATDDLIAEGTKRGKVLHSENAISCAEAFSKPILADAARYAENMDLAHCPLEDRESQMARLKAYIAASHPPPPILE
jgi:glycerol-3-phosphate O-acyltransferase